MGLLDGGIQALFGNVFSGLYLDGQWHKTTLVDNGKGGYSSVSQDFAIKYQPDDFSSYQRAAGNIPAQDVRIIVLQHNAGFAPKKDDTFTIGTGTYTVVDFSADPANSHWKVRGTRAGGA